jgi:hypothetical protein
VIPPGTMPKGAMPPGKMPPGYIPPGAMPGYPKDTGEEAVENDEPLWAYAIVQTKGKRDYYSRQTKKTYVQLDRTKWSTSPVYLPDFACTYITFPSVAARFETEVKNKLKGGKSAEKLILLAEWALEHGLLPQFHKMIDQLKEVAPNDPTLKVVEKTRDALKARPSRDDPAAASLVADLLAEGKADKVPYTALVSEQGHYTLLTNFKKGKQDPSIKRRLARMEETYQTFFYWFALKRRPLAVPAYRLVTVLPQKTQTFEAKHRDFDKVPMLADGFTARRDNTVLLSSRRLDTAFTYLQMNTEESWKKHPPSELFHYKKKEDFRGDLPKLPHMQTLALLKFAMEEESEWATVTHECVRQLEAATGLIPRNVNAAEWAQFGLASFFETPHNAFYATHAAPNWTQLTTFRHLRRTGKLNAKQPARVLLDVITDRYFREGYGLERLCNEADEAERAPLERKAQKELQKARSSAWALTYFLAREHLDELLAFYGEVGRLPRDVEYNEDALKQCFGRAFGLLTPDRRLDLKKVDRLARTWFTTLETVTLDLPQAVRELEVRLSGEAPRPKTRPQPGTNPGVGQPYNPGYGPTVPKGKYFPPGKY